MEKWKQVIIGVVVVLFLGVGYLFYSKEPEERVVDEFVVESEEVVPDETVERLEIVVYVTGAVESPNVYTVPEGARVGDVLSLAVLTDEADPEQLNLAQLLVDGVKIIVPKKGEAPIAQEVPSTELEANGVHVNSATKDELMSVPGIGPAKADAILNHLKENGPFKTYEDLGDVKGFGEKTLESMKPYLLVP
ncbi:helix-hairpin-helix domain-containing protein [Exiguobacterium sp. MMG028]|uniref:helix-hairpin-helix domain-containing protein n=1 Tax=unclassified Exiguobacterium TaxID=2644629 RepID=UPI001BECB9A6|nr:MULTISPECIES: helix-hairpin-helix domain-containing protein [unclassified Exiguobacterium]MDA5559382.1 helix-hairpin-helix domain-containing protein [Exiguobacterium sp. MMG028]